MRSVPRALTALVASLAIAACAAAGAGGAAAQAPSPPGDLYVLQADGGTLQRSGGTWRLTLRDPAATVTRFADRPARIGGPQRLKRFVAGWGATFGGDPPNAALQLDRAPPGRDIVLLELRRPRYDAKAGTLTFRVRPLRTAGGSRLGALARRADARVAAEFGRASLFIDDGPSNIGFGVTINLLGGAPGPPVTFTLALGNTEFQPAGQVEGGFSTGRTVLPGFTVDLAAAGIQVTLPSGSQAVVAIPIDFPATGAVQGIVTLPAGYTVSFTSEAGQVQATQSGPVTIPTPRPPPG
jgi:hypothetical protein